MLYTFSSRRRTLLALPLENRCVPNATLDGTESVKPVEPSPTDSEVIVYTATTTTPETAAPPAKRFAVGAGAGSNGLVNIYDAKTNAVISTITPFGTSYTGGVRVATADVNGDGIDDLVAATASGAGRVMIFDGATGATIGDFTPWTKSTGGAFVATGDVNGDGRADVVVGSGAGVAPEVRVFAGQSFSPTATITTSTEQTKTATAPTVVTAPTAIHTFTPSNGSKAFGVRVAAGDLNGDGKAEVVTASANSVVANSLSYQNEKASPTRRGAILRTTTVAKAVAFPTGTDTAGVFVAVGDFSGTGRNDIAVGFVANGRARVRVVNGIDRKSMVMDAYSFNAGTDGGVAVALRDVTGDGKAELLAASGFGTSIVRVLGGGTGGLTRSFAAFPASVQGGVYVG